MNYALGCAFNLQELIINFPYKKLKFNSKDCEDITGDHHRWVLIKQVFRYSVKVVLNDIINRNVTFYLPLTGSKKCCMHMRRVEGEAFKRLRQRRKWKDVDILASLFSGYEIGFYMMGNRTPREKTVYVSRKMRDLITENTNKSMAYGCGKIDTKIKDYYEQIYHQFPLIPQKDVRTILSYCWKSLYLHNSYGGDVLLNDNDLWCYFGKLKGTALQHFIYYCRKLTIKLRILYKKKKIPWDGYYYFALNELQYQSYLQQNNKRGKPRKYYDLQNFYMYKIQDECRIAEHSKKYIFRTKPLIPIKSKYFVSHFHGTLELVDIREPLKFKDVLTRYNKYEFL